MEERAKMTYNHDQVQALGQKLDRFAEDLSDEEKYLLGALFEVASQRVTGDPDLAFSERLHKIQGRIDVGAFHAMI